MKPTSTSLILVAFLSVSTLTGCLGMAFIGRVNLTANLSSLRSDVNAAMAHPLEPGQTAIGEVENGQFTLFQYGRIRVTRKVDGEHFVVFDRGGGHLGQQGYIYAPSATSSEQVHQEVFNGFEGREVWKMYGNWWAYDNPED